jgi:hypothetical protein
MKCNETLSKWCKNKHGAYKIIDTFETYHGVETPIHLGGGSWPEQAPGGCREE